MGALNGAVGAGSSGVDVIGFDLFAELPVVSIEDVSFTFAGACKRLLAAASGRCHVGASTESPFLRTLVSGPREESSSFWVIFFGLGDFFASLGFGRRSLQAVFKTSGSKSRAARSDRVGLLWVVFVGLVSVGGAIFVDSRFVLEEALLLTDG